MDGRRDGRLIGFGRRPELGGLGDDMLTRALATLPERHRRLMTLLLVEPPLEYRQISDILAARLSVARPA